MSVSASELCLVILADTVSNMVSVLASEVCLPLLEEIESEIDKLSENPFRPDGISSIAVITAREPVVHVHVIEVVPIEVLIFVLEPPSESTVVLLSHCSTCGAVGASFVVKPLI